MGSRRNWLRDFGAPAPSPDPSWQTEHFKRIITDSKTSRRVLQPKPDPDENNRKRLKLVKTRLQLEGWTNLDTAQWKYQIRKAQVVKEVDVMETDAVDVELMMAELGKEASAPS